MQDAGPRRTAPAFRGRALCDSLHSGSHSDIRAWMKTWNEDPRPYVWAKTAEQILDSIRRYCERIN